ncbi:phage tail assembly chaperone [Pseudomonas fakonensis]|uniref:Phage tail assembly chaperone n=2 Tax=Pseudomonas fakonensis TaxID=2842355 RepID=A0ABX8ND22_9PSED|nr:phage tail assembly chaperone [Pseudomonas fakonensis]
MPADAVEITEALYQEVITHRPLDKTLAHDERGVPYLVAIPQDATVLERMWRDSELLACTWLRDRHRDQIDIGGGTTLSTEQFAELLIFMQQLRDWPQAEAFPNPQYRPVSPVWVAEQTQ